MARDPANVAQEIEQLRSNQEQMVRDNAAVAEQLKATLSQMSRDNAAAVEQLKTTLSQMSRDNTAAIERLKASQEQMVRLTATRARRKSEPTLPQAETRPQAPVYSPPKQQ
jgi:chromosome condensin MukBEF ATPase and DNA-binding subunit MukB